MKFLSCSVQPTTLLISLDLVVNRLYTTAKYTRILTRRNFAYYFKILSNEMKADSYD